MIHLEQADLLEAHSESRALRTDQALEVAAEGSARAVVLQRPALDPPLKQVQDLPAGWQLEPGGLPAPLHPDLDPHAKPEEEWLARPNPYSEVQRSPEHQQPPERQPAGHFCRRNVLDRPARSRSHHLGD
jgi:hypothetical protein